MKLRHGFYFFLIVAGMSVCYYNKIISQLPRGIHEWAQADRYSLAVMFYDHGFNFFRPQTLNSSAIDNVVGVEFPYQSFVAAVFAIPFGKQNLPLIFRLITLLTVIIGLYYLFKLTYLFTSSFFVSLLPPVLLFCSPVFVYYSGNFQPDTNAVAFGLMAFYFYFLYLKSENRKHFLFSVLWITIGTLIKSSMVAYWIGIAIHQLYLYLKNRKQIEIKSLLKNIAALCFSFLLIVLFFLHNSYLNNKYQSWIFNYTAWLAKTNAGINHYDELKNILFNNMLNPGRWLFEYFLPLHYLILIATVILSSITLFKKQLEGKQILWMLLFSLPFVLIVFLVFGNQFVDHDYYFIAIFYPMFALVFVLFSMWLNKIFQSMQMKFSGIIICAMMVCFFYFSQAQQTRRISESYKGFEKYYHYMWMENGNTLLDEIEIPHASKILVMGEEAPNLALVYFDREGQVIAWYDTPQNIIKFMKKGRLDYLIMQKEKYDQLIADQPGYFDDFKLINAFPSFVVLAPSTNL